MDPGACVLVCDVKVDVEKHIMRIEVRKSKTNQFNERVHVIHIRWATRGRARPGWGLASSLRSQFPTATYASVYIPG